MKKKLSVDLIKEIEPLIKEHSSLLKIKESPDFLLLLFDADVNSTFHFGISKENSDSSGHYIHYQCTPQSTTSTAVIVNSRKLPDFIQYFKIWLSNIEFYNQNSILDDPILIGYQKEYYDDFVILDVDANDVGFTYEQQFLLDSFLGDLTQGIDEYSTPDNESIITEISSDINRLQSVLTTQSKNEFMRNLSKIFAKTRKAGLKASNFFMKEFLQHTAEKGSEWLFNFAVAHASELPKYIERFVNKMLIN